MGMGNFFLAAPEEVFPLAEEAALRALELEPALTDAKVWLAWVQFSYRRDWEATERILREVLEENRASYTAHYLLTYYLQAMGRYGEAAHEGDIITRLDPTSGGAHRAAARMLHIGRWFEDAERVMRWAIGLTPSATGGFLYLALTLEQMGRFEEAVAELQKAALGAGEDPVEVGSLQTRFAEEGMNGVWAQWLEWQLAGEAPRPGPVAIGFARLGNAEEAVAWLNRGVDVYESWLFQLNDPLWDPIRESVGFQDLLERLGLPRGRR
jgi:tetratricopeptide (TPR) repeat protein